MHVFVSETTHVQDKHTELQQSNYSEFLLRAVLLCLIHNVSYTTPKTWYQQHFHKCVCLACFRLVACYTGSSYIHYATSFCMFLACFCTTSSCCCSLSHLSYTFVSSEQVLGRMKHFLSQTTAPPPPPTPCTPSSMSLTFQLQTLYVWPTLMVNFNTTCELVHRATIKERLG